MDTDERRFRNLPKAFASLLGLAVIGGVIAWGVPATAPLFPAAKLASCTVIDQKGNSGKRSLIPTMYTDCGSFQRAGTVSCTTNPAKEVRLGNYHTYDLIVRGPQIPILMVPKIMSAGLSKEQRVEIPAEPSVEGLTGLNSEYIRGLSSSKDREMKASEKLREQWSPEKLRAFDYEQPPYDPDCDASLFVMTSRGLMESWPARAEQLLQVPEGVTPRDPKLPCEGYQCSAP
ncbi:hypothetical protein G7068_14655 [Leucobacter viscericola]|uniref:Uncharacterized protein n=1 Tax=Leucobacter viscericola TaxID=2714935 RepID=A0A6G7XID5_9MICO|nr:hypothetical protein [Leucobacter viscericola]QIK64303.1 hypothetical protein G7068_14655 [Leucobacter viscericola]